MGELQSPLGYNLGMENEPLYVLAWADYRRRLRWFWILFLSWFVMLGAVQIVGGLLHKDLWKGIAAPITMGGWWLLCIAAFSRVQYFRCPRCHRYFYLNFHLQMWNRGRFFNRCNHCLLPKWAITDVPTLPCKPITGYDPAIREPVFNLIDLFVAIVFVVFTISANLFLINYRWQGEPSHRGVILPILAFVTFVGACVAHRRNLPWWIGASLGFLLAFACFFVVLTASSL